MEYQMKITLEQQTIGAAVMQIAEHEQFTAINALKLSGKKINNSFLVNHNTVVLCKYSSKLSPIGEYTFSFTEENIKVIKELDKKHERLFFGLVCVEDCQICCLSAKQFKELIANRKSSADAKESSYTILVTAKPRASLRAYVNAARTRGKIAGKELTITRKAFPESIFS
jgi:hypothetical protein